MSHEVMGLVEEVRSQVLPPVKARRAIRLKARVPQVRMAAELGVHRVTFARWENGTFEPRGDNRARYARLLGQLRQAAGR